MIFSSDSESAGIVLVMVKSCSKNMYIELLAPKFYEHFLLKIILLIPKIV